jgi:thiosulfate reductase cytochrome b subunit
MLLLVPLVIFTGLALLYIRPAWSLVYMVGGLKVLVGLHFLVACALCAFVITHVYLATLGPTPWAHFKPMWDGWEEIEEKH